MKASRRSSRLGVAFDALIHFIAVNREFFGPSVSGLGQPSGASSVGAVPYDHPVVVTAPQA